MFKIQNLDLSTVREDMQLQMVRTYKGDIARTLSGIIVAFPASFITVGFKFQLLGPRSLMIQVQQLLLSANLVTITAEYNNTNIEGNFSCTNVDISEVRDKSERSLRLTASVVSDGTQITKPGGASFTVKAGATTLVANASFGKVYQLTGGPYKLNGINLPENKVLVLGDTQVEVI